MTFKILLAEDDEVTQQIVRSLLSGIAGIDVIRHLRAGNSCNRDTRVIRFTAEAEALRQPPSGCHSDIIMPKPIRGAEFVGVIEGVMANRSHTHENGIL